MITGDYSTLGQLIADNSSVKAQLNKLTAQIASGHVADSYGGLGGQATQVSLDLRPQLNTLTNEQTVIGSVTGQLDITQNALSQIYTIASSFEAQTASLNGIDPAAVDTVAASAKTALQQLAAVLDTTDGDGNYVFAGTDADHAPVPNPSDILTSGLYTQINAAVSGLSATTDNSASIIASTLATAQSNAAGTTPFSATIGTAQTLQLSNGQTVQIGLLANANTLAVSTGSSTTGSYVRDLLRSLSTIASLSSGQVNDPGFNAVVADARTSLRGAVTALSTETGALGTIQAELTTTSTADGDTSTALHKQLSSVEDVDTANALTQLSAVQTQLQASYQLIAAARNLSLVQYL